MSNFRLEFLRTRVARRILGLFVLGAVIPVAVLAFLSFNTVRDQLKDQSEAGLTQISDRASQSILERLTFYDTWLGGVGALAMQRRAAGSGAQGRPATVEDLLPSGVAGLALDSAGVVLQLAGSVGDLPALSSDEIAHLAEGETVLRVAVGTDGAPASVHLGRNLGNDDPESGDVLWARIYGDSVWATAIVWASFTTIDDFCVLDSGAQPFYCNEGLGSHLPSHITPVGTHPVAGLAELEEDSETRIIAWRDVYLRSSYDAPSWTVVVSESETSVYSPLDDFRYSVPITFMIGLAAAFLLSNVLIRRTMEPLEKLTEGTRRLARRDLSTRVDVQSDDEFGELAESFNTMAARLGLQFSQIEAGQAIDQAALSAEHPRVAVRALLEGMGEVVCKGPRSVFLLEPGSEDEGILYSLNSTSDTVAEGVRSIGRPDADWLDDGPEYIVVRNGRDVPGMFGDGGDGDGSGPTLILRLAVKKRSVGAVAITIAEGEDFSEEQVGRARHLVDQASVALNELRLRRELEEMSWETLHALANAIDAKSEWTAGHSERVTALAREIGSQLGLPAEQGEILHRGGLLHDIGKIGVPVSVLDFTGPLEGTMLEQMRAHPVIGARILEPIRAFKPMLPIVLYHHERWDGKGYPEGLKALEIPPLARLLSVADVFDAMVSARPYRGALEMQNVAEHIINDAGAAFDPEIVEAFAAVLDGGWTPRPLDGGVLIDA